MLGAIATVGGRAPRARPVHRHDARRPGVQAPGRARHRGRHRALRRGVRAVLRRARRRRGRRRGDRGRARRPHGPARRRRLLHRDVLRAVTVRAARTTAAASTRSATRSSATTATRWLYPVLLTSLIEAADRVDSTTGVQMAYVKQWADRSFRPLELRVPELVAGAGRGACAPTRCDVVRDARVVRPRVPRSAVQPAPLLHELPRVGDARRVGRARALRRRVQAGRRARPVDEERVQRAAGRCPTRSRA